MEHDRTRGVRRVLFVNRSYWPDAEATGQLLTELCEDLADQFDVTVLVGQPNANPDGVSFERRGWAYRRGVAIRRVRHTQFSNGSSAVCPRVSRRKLRLTKGLAFFD